MTVKALGLVRGRRSGLGSGICISGKKQRSEHATSDSVGKSTATTVPVIVLVISKRQN